MQEHIGGEFKDIVLETTYMDLNGNLHKINNEEQKLNFKNGTINKSTGIVTIGGISKQYALNNP